MNKETDPGFIQVDMPDGSILGMSTADRVSAGIMYLTEHFGENFMDRLDADILDISCPLSCVVAQLDPKGNFDTSIHALSVDAMIRGGMLVHSESGDDAVSPSEHAEFAALNLEWKNRIVSSQQQSAQQRRHVPSRERILDPIDLCSFNYQAPTSRLDAGAISLLQYSFQWL